MKPSFVIAIIGALILISLFVIGLLVNQPLGMLAYLCLSPFAFLAVGRTSVGLMRRRAALLTDDEARHLDRLRTQRRS